MSPAPEIVVAGGGIAAAATAIRLRHLGFGVRLLVRRDAVAAGIEAVPERALGLLDVLGETQLVADAGGAAVVPGGSAPPLVHVDRRCLARAFLDRAQVRGAVIAPVRRLPPASELGGPAVIDATGRAAAWSRPLVTDGHDVAWQFEGPPQADVALRMVQGERWWAYRLGTASATWAGVVVDGRDGAAGQRTATTTGLGRLGLDQATMAPRGRRAARVQRAVRPVDGPRIAVGDAALAHDPVAGAGIRFALASAIAAATTVATWFDDAGDRDLAAGYYEDLVVGEHRRHLEARRSVHPPQSQTVPLDTMPLNTMPLNTMPLDTMPLDTMPLETVPLDRGRTVGPEPVPDRVRFSAAVVETPLAVDGLIRSGAAIGLPDGSVSRWLGSFDLLTLARLAAEPVARIVLLARLQQEGLDLASARAVLAWALRHGMLTG